MIQRFCWGIALVGIAIILISSSHREHGSEKIAIAGAPQPAEEPKPESAAALSSTQQIDSELLRLRGEVAVLRKTLRDNSNTVAATKTSLGSEKMISSEKFFDAGFESPESSIQTICWAAFSTNIQRYKEGIVWGDDIVSAARAHAGDSFDPKNIFITLTSPQGLVQGLEILNTEQQAPDHVIATVATLIRNGTSETREIRHMELVNVNNQWKWLIPNPADVSIIPFVPSRE